MFNFFLRFKLLPICNGHYKICIPIRRHICTFVSPDTRIAFQNSISRYSLDFSDQYNSVSEHNLDLCSWWHNIIHNAFTIQIL